MEKTIKNTAMPVKERLKGSGQMSVIVGMLVIFLVGVVFVAANPQGDDSDAKSVKEMSTVNDAGNILRDAQIYASHMGVSVDEAVRRLRLQTIPVPQNELEISEASTFAGLWIEHTPEFKYVVVFTRNGEKTIEPYLKRYPEFAKVVEVRNTAKASLSELRRAHARILSFISTSNIPINSDINIVENCIELYVKKNDYGRLNDTLKKIKLPANIVLKIIPVDALAEPLRAAREIYGGLPLVRCTSGFSVIRIDGTRGITTAGHCSNIQFYMRTILPLMMEIERGPFDIQWHIAPGFTVTNKIQVTRHGYTLTVRGAVYRRFQVIGTYVCKYGKTTGYTCGHIRSIFFNPGDKTNSPTYIRVSNTAGYDNVALLGDSGGPFFVAIGRNALAYGTTTHGIIPGTTGKGVDGVYMAVDFLEQGLGVRVMTS